MVGVAIIIWKVAQEWHSMSFLGRDSVVGVATRYGLSDPGIESRLGRDFPHPSDSPWVPPSLLYNMYRIFFPGVKRPGRDLDHPPPYSADVKERIELNLYSLSRTSRPVLGGIVPFPLRYNSWDTEEKYENTYEDESKWMQVQSAIVVQTCIVTGFVQWETLNFSTYGVSANRNSTRDLCPSCCWQI